MISPSSLLNPRKETGGEGSSAGPQAMPTKKLSSANPEKAFLNFMVPERKSSSIESKTWWHQCTLTQVKMDYPKSKGGATFSHVVMVVYISSNNREFWHGALFCSLWSPVFYDYKSNKIVNLFYALWLLEGFNESNILVSCNCLWNRWWCWNLFWISYPCPL